MKRKLWAKSPNNPNELSIWTKKNYQYLVVARSGSPRGGFWFEDKSKALKRADFYTKKFQHENGDRKFIVVPVYPWIDMGEGSNTWEDGTKSCSDFQEQIIVREFIEENDVSCNTEQQWACKFDDWLQNKYEFTQEEVDELQADRKRQVGRETS